MDGLSKTSVHGTVQGKKKWGRPQPPPPPQKKEKKKKKKREEKQKKALGRKQAE